LDDASAVCTAVHDLLQLRKGCSGFTDAWKAWQNSSGGGLWAHGATAAVGVVVLAAGATLFVSTLPATGAAAGVVATTTSGSALVANAAAIAKGSAYLTLAAGGLTVAGSEGQNFYISVNDFKDMRAGQSAKHEQLTLY